MRGFRLFERPVGVFATVPPLYLDGELASYLVGQPYEGRVGIFNPIGRCTVEIVPEHSNLPPGSTAHVDNFSKEVVLRWPAYSPPEEEKPGIINWDFETGDLTGWHDRRGGGWHVARYDNSPESEHPPNNNPPTELGNHAAYMTGVGRGDWILESERYPVEAGQQIMARSLWDQGPSNKDNNNLFTALNIWRNDFLVDTIYGDRIHDRTNRQRHWSTVNFTVLPTYTDVSVLLIAHRRNNRNRPIIVDNVETSGLHYAVGTPTETYFHVRFKVTDSAGRVAFWDGIITEASAVFLTSSRYPIVEIDSITSTGSVQGMDGWDTHYADNVERVQSTGQAMSLELWVSQAYYEYTEVDAIQSTGSVQSLSLEVTTNYFTTSGQDAIQSTGSVQAISMEVTTNYIDYTEPHDSITSTGSVQGIEMQ